jgi:hypothetical protein
MTDGQRKEEIEKVRVPPGLFEELWMLEVDTYDPDIHDKECPEYGEFVKAMSNAVERKRYHVLTLNEAAFDYMFLFDMGALNNAIDILGEPCDRARKATLARAAQRLLDEYTVSSGDPDYDD